MYAQAGVHLVRRGVEAAQASLQGVSPEYMQKLQQDAELYENAGPEMELKPHQLLPVMITGFIFVLLIASIRYTLGEVVASLAMIESPSSTAIIEPKPPAYADEPDARVEKDPLIPMEAAADADVEITVINHKPITSKIRSTIAHLHRVGGFRARWRGLFLSIFYHFVHNLVSGLFSFFLGFGLFGNALCYVIASVLLARLHMVWTHSMIAYPSSKSWYSRVVPRKQSKAVLLPSLVFALAQQATLILPIAVGFLVGLGDIDHTSIHSAHGHVCPKKVLKLALRFLPVPLTALVVALAILLPASVTLTRIEAALLSEEEETIVPFDREAVTADIDMTQRGSARRVFVQAWRSFDRAARLRLIKLYVKMILIQVVIAVIGLQVMVAEIYVIGGEKLAIFFTSARAQLQLAAIEAQENAN